MKRTDRVFQALTRLWTKQKRGYTTQEIAQEAGISRSNCSSELNLLCRDGVINKVTGRPTRYLPEISIKNIDAFSSVVGFSRSLSQAVRLAKAAVSYPPVGMHVLILGEAGVGKSTFAKTMHTFAIEQHHLTDQAPFVTFNCAEYANNPEILLDHLFGHVKGAFTGADADKPGLIELADTGVLFLDEIHRLPPQGQEMLFHWLDTGNFQRMGETSTRRRSQALLFAATTETDESVLLLTFRRRIPVTIALPSLREWSIYDRYELIYRLLVEEAQVLNVSLRLKGEAVKRLLFAHLPGNIGGLRNTLKLACAQAYISRNQQDELIIDEHLIQLGETADNLSLTGLFSEQVKDMSVSPFEIPRPLKTSIFEDSLSEHLARLGQQLQVIGLDHEEIVVAIERELMRRQFAKSLSPSLAELQRFVGDAFYTMMRSCWQTVSLHMDPEQEQDAFVRVCIHLSGLVRDVQELRRQLNPSLFTYVKSEYPMLYDLSASLLSAVSRALGVDFPEHEIALVALLLKAKEMNAYTSAGIVVMMRGDAVASQMVQSVQKMSGNQRLISIDVPFDVDPNDLQDQFIAASLLASAGQGVLVLTDLIAVCDWVRQRPDRQVIFRPDVTTLLQVVLANEVSHGDVAELYAMVEEKKALPVVDAKNHDKVYQIWTCCLTGRGSAVALKRYIEKELPEKFHEHIKIVPVEVSQKGQVNTAYGSDLLVTVGSIRPDIRDVPFLSVEQLLAPQGMSRLLAMINHRQSISLQEEEPATVEVVPGDLFRYARKMLEDDLTVVNPVLALKVAQEAIAILQKGVTRELDEPFQVRFTMHMACAVERMIRGESLPHPDTEFLMTQNPIIWQLVQDSLAPFEAWFRIEITPGEMAYICNMIM